MVYMVRSMVRYGNVDAQNNVYKQIRSIWDENLSPNLVGPWVDKVGNEEIALSYIDDPVEYFWKFIFADIIYPV